MNKIIVGVGLLICGVLGDFTRSIDIVIALVNADLSAEPLRQFHGTHFTVLSDLALVFVIPGAILSLSGLALPNKSKNGTKIVLIGTVLFMCGIFGDFTNSIRNLFDYVSFASVGLSPMSLGNTMLSDFTLVFIVAGTILCIWGLVDKDENETKRVVLGAGLIMCGVARIFFHTIMSGILFISQVRAWEQFPPESGFLHAIRFEYALIIAGVMFSIWGLIKKGKKEA